MEYKSSELMTVNAARLLKDGDTVFVGVGVPNLACNLARRTHAPNLVMIYEARDWRASSPPAAIHRRPNPGFWGQFSMQHVRYFRFLFAARQRRCWLFGRRAN
jgi:acyl CoA:acetate/3-ketoacid CoA transferase beta subunit